MHTAATDIQVVNNGISGLKTFKALQIFCDVFGISLTLTPNTCERCQIQKCFCSINFLFDLLSLTAQLAAKPEFIKRCTYIL